MLTFIQKSYSQSPGKNETLEYLNKILGNQTHLEISTNNLRITIKDESGRIIRKDKVLFTDLEHKSFYEEESDLFCVPCLSFFSGCVTRLLTIQKIKRPYERISIIAGGSDRYKKLEKAFEHLIRIMSEVGYKDEITLD